MSNYKNFLKERKEINILHIAFIFLISFIYVCYSDEDITSIITNMRAEKRVSEENGLRIDKRKIIFSYLRGEKKDLCFLKNLNK